MSFLIIVLQCSQHQNMRPDDPQKFAKRKKMFCHFDISVGNWKNEKLFYRRNVENHEILREMVFKWNFSVHPN